MCPKEYLFWQYSAVILDFFLCPVCRISRNKFPLNRTVFNIFWLKNKFRKNGLIYWKMPFLEYSLEYKSIQKCPAHATFIKIDQTRCTVLYSNTVNSEYRCIMYFENKAIDCQSTLRSVSCSLPTCREVEVEALFLITSYNC